MGGTRVSRARAGARVIWIALFAASVGAGWLLGKGDAAANGRAAILSGPAVLLVLLLGLTGGLCAWDRVRLRRTYASPTLAYLGKRLLLGALAAGGTFALSPVGWGPACLHAFAVAGALGALTWMGNLPAKL